MKACFERTCTENGMTRNRFRYLWRNISFCARSRETGDDTENEEIDDENESLDMLLRDASHDCREVEFFL